MSTGCHSGVPVDISRFLGADSPQAWVTAIAGDVETMLIDHANCELKAASTALAFLYRYPERRELAWQMSRLAREELRHYEQVTKLMDEAGFSHRRLSASRYAKRLNEACSTAEPARLIDGLLVGAFIEARSCERFAMLVDVLREQRLRDFYQDLLASEARHYRVYLELAEGEAHRARLDIDARVSLLRELEAELATGPDVCIRFHSGPLV